MLLTIDVGNTNITVGVFKEDDLIGSFRLTTKNQRTSDEFGLTLCNMLITKKLNPNDVKDVIISSVVPKLMHSLNNAIKKYFEVEPLIIGPGIKTGIKIHTENPKEVGADRIVNVAAAYHQYKQACLIIDFGTATTFDFISKDGVFEYTIITPGIEIAAQALITQAAKLPDIEIKKPKSILAKNTIDGMQAGLVYGYIGQVEYIVKKMKEQLNADILVIATGGLGRIIIPHTKCIDKYIPELAYQGMKFIFEKNKENLK